MLFEFMTAQRIIFGPGTISQAGSLAASMGKRALVIVGSTDAAVASERAAPLLESLEIAGVAGIVYVVNSEPTIDTIRQGVGLAKDENCSLVIGFGGGSAMDTGKAVAALITNPGNLTDYLEVVGPGKPINHPPAPYIAIPTTAGTGAEVTRNAVIGVPDRQVKVSLRSPLMLPRLALVDPQLTYRLPASVTASTGMDALTQLIEPFVSNRYNPLTDALCREGIRRAAHSLPVAYLEGENLEARENMSLASLFSGLALANAKLGAVHGFAGVLGGMFPAPHGAICARLLPVVMDVNVRVLQDRGADGNLVQRYDEVARLLTGDRDATAIDGAAWVRDLCNKLQIPPLASYGLTPADFPIVIEQSAIASSMQGNPVVLTPQEMVEILSRAL